jgi:tetratricopeptide (TPR) repeat protein
MSTLADLPELVGFFSYSREDDEAFEGTLSALRDGIQRELGAQLGRSKATFRLWQDHAAIAPGKLWESEIKTAVDQSIFFIPIVTPRAVNSKYCKIEFESFLAREAAIGRNDLIFPILYISVAALENETKWRDDPVLSTIGRRQYVDWRQLRHLDARTTAVREQIERLCRKIVEALNEPWMPPEERRRLAETEARQQAADEVRRLEDETKRKAGVEERRRRLDAEAREQAETERRREEAKAKRREDEEEGRRQAEADARLRDDEERGRRAAQVKRSVEDAQAFAAAKGADAVPGGAPAELVRGRLRSLKSRSARGPSTPTAIVACITLVLLGIGGLITYVRSRSARAPAPIETEMTVTGLDIPTFTGPAGGPFGPARLIIEIKSAGRGFHWSAVAANLPWIGIEPAEGDLGAYRSAEVVLTPAPAASALLPGQYDGELTFKSPTKSITQAMHLAVSQKSQPVAQPTLADDRTTCGGDSWDEAILACGRIIASNKLSPLDLAVAFQHRARAYDAKKDYDHTIADYSEAIRLDPKSAFYVEMRGVAYSDKQDYDDAIADYNEAIKLGPNDSFAFNMRGNAYAEMHDNDRAIADFDEAIRLRPDYAVALFLRGYAKNAKGDEAGGAADIAAAQKLDPTLGK